MNKKIILYILSFACFLMPIISVEGIIPWIVAIFLINKSFKYFKNHENIKGVVLNTIYCALIIISYNILGKFIEKILVKLWV